MVLAASHTGNWELVAFGAAQALAAHDGSPSSSNRSFSSAPFMRSDWNLREACGLTLLAPRGAMVEAKRALKSEHVVAMPIDQVPERERHGVGVAFLGGCHRRSQPGRALARRPPAPPLLVAAGSRDGRTNCIDLLAELDAESQRTRGRVDCRATCEVNRALEAFVRSPSSWLWLHRRWRAPFDVGSGAADRVQGRRAGSLVATGG